MKMINDTLYIRARIIQSIRDFFISRDFLEVDTPLRIPANAPEEHINPFPASISFLQTSPEICMKRLLSRGYDKLFQISHCWRSDERGRLHLPEFTMLEWYRSHCDYLNLMDDCKDLLDHIDRQLSDDSSFCYTSLPVVLHDDYIRISVQEAFEAYCPVTMESALQEGTFDEMMVTRIEPGLDGNRPVILMDYPIEMGALARAKECNPEVAERFELYIAGMELANGFSELNDATEQRKRFEQANVKRQELGLEALPLPEPFLRDLERMPPSAGIALGIDRLVMLFTGAERIDEVVAFTPESL